MSLSKKLSISIGFLIAVVAAGTAIVLTLVASNALMDTTAVLMDTQVRSGREIVRQEIDLKISKLQAISAVLGALPVTAQERRAFLSTEKKGLDFLEIAFVDMRGIADYGSDEESINLHDRSYIKTALSGKPAVSDVLISRATGEPVVMYCVPIFHLGSVVGAVLGRARGTDLSSYVDAMGFGESGYAYIVNGEGTVIAHPDASMVLDQFNPLKLLGDNPELAGLAAFFENFSSSDNGTGMYEFNGRDIFAEFFVIDNSDWKLVVTAEKSEFLGSLTHMRIIGIIACAVFILIGVVVSVLFTRSITGKIDNMIPVIDALSDGNLSLRMSVTSKDEMGQMSKSYNTAVDRLSDMLSVTKQSSEQMGLISEELGQNMMETAASMNQISSNINRLNGQCDVHSASITETDRVISEMQSRAVSLSDMVNEQSSVVTETSAAVEELLSNIKSVSKILNNNSDSIDELVKASESGKEGIAKLSEIAGGIENNSSSLLETIDVIQNIASQTNLLSMNAAIEAAHAGDAGKGFAVVAEEIRKLAEDSSTEGKSISEALKKLKEEISTIASLSTMSDRQFDDISRLLESVRNQEYEIKCSMQEQDEGSSVILESVQMMNNISQEVKTGSDVMIEGCRNVSGTMEQLKKLTFEMHASMNEMVQGTRMINEAIQNVNNATQEMNAGVEQMASEVAVFTV